MTKETKLLIKVLGWLEDGVNTPPIGLRGAIKEALAQPVQEPVAVVDLRNANYVRWLEGVKYPVEGTKLYTTPPLPVQPEQEPVAFDAFLNSKEFYELMQTYRHFQIDAFKQFEAVKDALRAAHNIGGK